MHWLPNDKRSVPVEVLMPDGNVKNGFGEEGIRDLKEGDIVQLERFAFCRLDKKGKKFVFCYTHRWGGKMIIVKSNIKKYSEGFDVAAEFIETLDKENQKIIKKAVERARANGRHTLMARDI